MLIKLIQTINLCQSIILTINENVIADGGQLKVETKEKAGTFTIELPKVN